ncbi:MFS transporter [Streptomyces sp. NBC_00203]|uniref:MFS transporter n=1 Tax=Streptomyces sp. NBC_00203 TaxID=2975680 RepID=UPI003254EB9C
MKGLVARYGELLRLPGARDAVVYAACARLAVTMIPVALLLTVVEAGRSFGVAGGAAGAYAVGSACGQPVAGRIMDRARASIVLRVLGTAVFVALLGTAGAARHAPVAALFGCALLAGALAPPVGASVRALWPRLTDDETLRQRAYSFEATLTEFLYIAGPSLITLLAATIGAFEALLVAAVVMASGTWGYARAHVVRDLRPSRAVRAPAERRKRRPVAALTVLTAIGLTAALSSALAVAVAALLDDIGSTTALAGVLLASQSAGSVVGGLVYGSRHRSGTTYARYIRLLVVLTLGLALLPLAALAHGTVAVVVLAVLLIGSGTPIAPAGAEEFQLIGDMTEDGRMTQAFAGVGSFIQAGSAAGSAAAGVVAQHLGASPALLMPAACTALALVLVCAARRPIAAATTPLGPLERNPA